MSPKFLLLQAGVLAAGIAALAAATDGFRVVTSEGARRLAIAAAPPTVPDVSLTDQNGAAFSLADYRGTTVLVEFIYTRCPTICGLLGEGFGALQDRIKRARQPLALLSVSFDPTHDDVAALKAYGERFGATAPLWRVAAPSAAGLRTLLQSFGAVVIPDGFGGFTHNAAISVIDAQGRFVRIVDATASPRLFDEVATLAAR